MATTSPATGVYRSLAVFTDSMTPKASDFLRFYRDQSVRVHKAKEMSDEELEGKIVIGKLVERERTEFGASLRRINEKFREGRA